VVKAYFRLQAVCHNAQVSHTGRCGGKLQKNFYVVCVAYVTNLWRDARWEMRMIRIGLFQMRTIRIQRVRWERFALRFRCATLYALQLTCQYAPQS